MGIEDNKRVVLGFFENINAGKIDEALDALADDATWWVQGSLGISGTKTKAEFAGMLNALYDGDVRVTPTGITAEGDRVALEGEEDATMANGKTLHNTFHLLFIVRDEKIEAVKEYMDTHHANEVLG